VWGNSVDLFALGVALLQCFVMLPVSDTPMLLNRVASDIAFLSDRCEPRPPFWLQKAAAMRGALEVARALTGPDPRVRSALDPVELASRLEECLPAMSPVSAVGDLRQSGRPNEAMEMAHAVLLDDASYELLLLSARIAWQDLGNALEGLSLLDRAAATMPDRVEAYAEQLELISSLRSDIVARIELATDASFAARLDAVMDAAFTHLTAQEQGARADTMAWYLIERGQLERANRFIYGKLHDGQTLMWWRFDLMLAYAETFLRLGRLDEARRQAGAIKQGLARVRQQGSVPEEEVRRHGADLAKLELRLSSLPRSGGQR
jgi:hypothetical protein